MALVSEFTWLATPDASWSSAALCAFRLLAAFEMSPASVDADESTCSRSALLVGLLSSDENESKKLVMSLPMSPAVELDEPESGVNKRLNRVQRRQPRTRGRSQLLLLVEPLLQHAVPQRGRAGLRHSVAIRNSVDLDRRILLPVGRLLRVAGGVGIGHVVGHNAQRRLIGFQSL